MVQVALTCNSQQYAASERDTGAKLCFDLFLSSRFVHFSQDAEAVQPQIPAAAVRLVQAQEVPEARSGVAAAAGLVVEVAGVAEVRLLLRRV